jgi:hypothetical protein
MNWNNSIYKEVLEWIEIIHIENFQVIIWNNLQAGPILLSLFPGCDPVSVFSDCEILRIKFCAICVKRKGENCTQKLNTNAWAKD